MNSYFQAEKKIKYGSHAALGRTEIQHLQNSIYRLMPTFSSFFGTNLKFGTLLTMAKLYLHSRR